jgi:hypothetical protein
VFSIEIRHVMRLLVVGLCVAAASCARGAEGPKSVDAATAVVAAHLPNGWTVATREANYRRDTTGAIRATITAGHEGSML